MFYTCETSNLVIVTSQILVINKFLNYQFLSYGLNVSVTQRKGKKCPFPFWPNTKISLALLAWNAKNGNVCLSKDNYKLQS